LDEIWYADAKSCRKKTANIIVKKLSSFITLSKYDICQLADLKKQISQKMILLRSTVTFRRCAAK